MLNPQNLKGFEYAEELSSENNPVYVRTIIGKLTRVRVQTIAVYCSRLGFMFGIANYELEMMIIDVGNVQGILLVLKKHIR